MKTIIQYILKILARKIYQKYQPEVIGITGSVGKTGAKEAVYAVLKDKFSVRQSRKNYNNEIGLPLTLIGADPQGKNIFGWLGVFRRGLELVFGRDDGYPGILILEMGADKPGDIEYLLEIVKCRIGILTRIGEAHLEAFGSVDRIKKEKSLIIKKLEKSGWAVLNFDDERVKSLAGDIKANYISYGIGREQKADLQASDLGLARIGRNGWGMSFKLHYRGAVVPARIPGALHASSVYACLAGAAAGLIYKMNLIEISEALKKYRVPIGRMNLIAGIKGAQIIDDTYNASPQSCHAALEVLAAMEPGAGGSKWAVFGDMLELGDYTEAGHREVGVRTAELKIDYLLAVGERSRHIIRGARETGMDNDRIFHFDGNLEAGKFLEDRIKKGDLILIKGSQGARMEKIVKEIMADPLRAGELIARQEAEWK
jgi:UDP-N-acetylmuramoyl-tripeptide--D-alanyl-D-alanine ligase